MHNFEYREPDTLEEALALLGELGEEAKIVAGGLPGGGLRLLMIR